jgi:hypothetical protein
MRVAVPAAHAPIDVREVSQKLFVAHTAWFDERISSGVSVNVACDALIKLDLRGEVLLTQGTAPGKESCERRREGKSTVGFVGRVARDKWQVDDM